MSAVHVANQKGLHICSVWNLLWQKSRFSQSTMVILQLQRQPFHELNVPPWEMIINPSGVYMPRIPLIGPEPGPRTRTPTPTPRRSRSASAKPSPPSRSRSVTTKHSGKCHGIKRDGCLAYIYTSGGPGWMEGISQLFTGTWKAKTEESLDQVGRSEI